MAVTTALAIIVARYLGPSEFGVFAGFLSLTQVLMLFSSVGIPTLLLRELSNALAKEGTSAWVASERMLSAGLALIGILTLVLALGASAVAKALGSSTDLAVALFALQSYMGLLAGAAVIEAVFRARRRLSFVVIATLLEKLVLTAIVVAAITQGAGIAGIAAGYVIAGVLRVSFGLYAMRTRSLALLRAPAVADAAVLVRSSLPFALGSAVPSAIVRLDVLVIGFFSVTTAGHFAVADRIVSALRIIATTGAITLYPLLARERDPLRASWLAAGALGLAGAALATAGVLLTDVGVPFLFGSQYEAAVPGVRIGLLAVPLIFAATPLMAGMFSGGHERRVLVVMLICNLTGTVFVVLGQASLGLEGATGGNVLRNLVLLVALAALSSKLRSRTQLAEVRSEPPAEPAGRLTQAASPETL